MATIRYQAENLIEFIYDYLDESGAAIDVSAASAITLYLSFPDGTESTVTGTYNATASHNEVVATTLVTTITNAKLNNQTSGIVTWQFLVVVAGERIWGLEQKLTVYSNLA